MNRESPALDVLIASRTAPTYAGGLAAYQLGLAEELQKCPPGCRVGFLHWEETRSGMPVTRPLPPGSHILEKQVAEHRRLWMGLASRPVLHGLLERLIHRAFRPILRDESIPTARIVHFVGTGWDFTGFGLREMARRRGARFTVWPAVHPGQWGDDRIDLRLYASADAVFCQSRHEASQLEALGLDRQKIVLCGLPPMCLPERDGGDLRAQWGAERPVVLFLGRRDRAKGYPALLEAWRTVLQRHPSALLVLAGPSDPTEKPPEINLPEGTFVDLGIPDEETKARALAACDVFCLPSAHESFGIVYVEAWSYGKPVVCGTAPAAREWIRDGETGLHTTGHPADIAETLGRLLDNADLRNRLGEAGRKFQHSALTWEIISRIHLEAFGIGPPANHRPPTGEQPS